MAAAFVGVGSNIDREHNVRSAVGMLRKRFGSLLVSPVYESPAVGFDGDPFLNLVVRFDADIAPLALSTELLAVELAHGRRREGERFGPRTLDLDLLLYGDTVLKDGALHIPHSDILDYSFVLRPLADIAPGMRHPELGKTFAALWQAARPSPGSLKPIALTLDD